VRDERDRFERWRASLVAVPTLRALHDHVEALARDELARALPPGASPEERAALSRLAEGLVARLLHAPLERLRAEAEEGEGPYFAHAARALFGLEDPEEEEDDR
jgi:glutamyl-tRNA reductase